MVKVVVVAALLAEATVIGAMPVAITVGVLVAATTIAPVRI